MKTVKSNITPNEVKHVALLAHLKLTEKEVKMFQEQLSDILDYIDKLNELDIKGTESTNQVTNLENVFREDNIVPSLSQKEALSNAPSQYNGYFKVEAIFED